MRKRSLPLAALLLVLSMSAVRAEAGPRDVRYHYDKGVALFEKQKYGAAQALSLIHISEPTRRP